MSKVIAIAGGIGSGKSVVCGILRKLGYAVYDSDLRARALMDASREIKDFLVREIHPEAIGSDGTIDRARVGEVVFASEEKRLLLNAAVHAAVREDFAAWCLARAQQPLLFVECAILCESGLADYVDDTWVVTAPEAVRVERVCRRNNLSADSVRARIASQGAEAAAIARLPHKKLLNDGRTPLLPQIESLLHAI